MTDTHPGLRAGATPKQVITQLRRTGRAYLTAQGNAERAMAAMRAAAADAAAHGVTVSEIARVTGVSRNAIYRALGRRD